MTDETRPGHEYEDNVIGRGRFPREGGVSGGSGGGSDFDVGSRLIRLEEQSRLSDERIRRLEGKIDQLLERVSVLPGRSDLVSFAALMLAVIGLFIGGMGWLETRAARVAAPPSMNPSPPTIIEVPALPAGNFPTIKQHSRQ